MPVPGVEWVWPVAAVLGESWWRCWKHYVVEVGPVEREGQREQVPEPVDVCQETMCTCTYVH